MALTAMKTSLKRGPEPLSSVGPWGEIQESMKLLALALITLVISVLVVMDKPLTPLTSTRHLAPRQLHDSLATKLKFYKANI